MAVSGYWLSLLRRLELAHRNGHCYWFFTGIYHRGAGGVRRVEYAEYAFNNCLQVMLSHSPMDRNH